MSWWNPLSWKFADTLGAPDQTYKSDIEDNHEKIKSLVEMPVILPFFDHMQVADENQAMRFAYRQMFRSPIVKAAFLQKIFNVGTLKFEVHPASKRNKNDVEIANAFKWQIVRRLEGGLADLCWNVLGHGGMDGFSVNEKVWTTQKEGRYKNKEVLRQLKPKDVDQDLYLWADAYRNITSVQGLKWNSGERWDPRDFIIYQHMPLFGTPSGLSDFRAVYADFWALDTVEKLRAMGAEKRAFPIIAAEYPSGGTQQSVQNVLTQLRFSNWLAVPRDTKIHVINLAGSSDEYFTSFRRDKIENIFVGLQFAFLQSITGGKGEYRGSSQVAQQTSALTVWWLSQQLIKIFNHEETGLIKEFVDRNYRGVSDYPYVTLTQMDMDSLVKLMGLYQKMQEMGWKHDIEHMEETFGIPYSHRPENTLPTIMQLNASIVRGKPTSGEAKSSGDEGTDADPEPSVSGTAAA